MYRIEIPMQPSLYTLCATTIRKPGKSIKSLLPPEYPVQISPSQEPCPKYLSRHPGVFFSKAGGLDGASFRAGFRRKKTLPSPNVHSPRSVYQNPALSIPKREPEPKESSDVICEMNGEVAEEGRARLTHLFSQFTSSVSLA